GPRSGQVLTQRGNERDRKHDDSVLRAFSLTHDHGATCEINILHPQTQAFHDPHPRPVEQLDKQLLLTVQGGKYLSHFLMSEYHRQTDAALRTSDFIHPRQVEAQHLLVEEQERRQRLLVGGNRALSL